MAQSPTHVKINDTMLKCDAKRTNESSIRIQFPDPYKISCDQTTPVGTFFHIYTPFDIWGIDTNIGDYIPMNYTNEFTTHMDASDIGELYAQSTRSNGEVSRNIFYHDVSDKNTKLRVIFTCDRELPGTYETHPHDITSVCVIGIEIYTKCESTASSTELYFIMLGLLLSGVLCGPIIAVGFVYTMYKSIIYMNDAYSGGIYHEKRLVDW